MKLKYSCKSDLEGHWFIYQNPSKDDHEWLNEVEVPDDKADWIKKTYEEYFKVKDYLDELIDGKDKEERESL